jgi:putative spermidine/putrescine transport system ATP-binding protein
LSPYKISFGYTERTQGGVVDTYRMAHVELIELCKTFAGKAALHGLRLSIEQGELVSLLGPSGCGKTTTLRIVAGFEMPDSGGVRLGGQNLLEVAPNLRGMGVVFQSYALFPHLTAWKNVAFGMKMKGRPGADIRRRVPELLELVGLADAAGKYPHEMSGGQQQRIALARALAIEPRMLLLDEPLSALDAVVRVSLRDEIRRIQTTLGMTTLYVTHDQEEALAISDRIAVMRDGRIEQVGTSEDIYARPATRFVAGFIGKMNQLPGRVVAARQGYVQCGAHKLQVPPETIAKLEVGSVAIVLVRPETIMMIPAGSDIDAATNTVAIGGRNKLAACVEGVTFLGSVRRIVLDAAGQRLVADVSGTALGQVRRGDRMTISFPVDACRVIGDDRPPSGISEERDQAEMMRGVSA